LYQCYVNEPAEGIFVLQVSAGGQRWFFEAVDCIVDRSAKTLHQIVPAEIQGAFFVWRAANPLFSRMLSSDSDTARAFSVQERTLDA